jgi:glucan phosphoethanolaminetransferase (alkaline phosphatase superfamily)
MKTIPHSAQIMLSKIERMIEKLLRLFLLIKVNIEKLKELGIKLTSLDGSNPEYFAMLNDRRENNKMFLYIFVTFLSVFIDFFLLFNALTILCTEFNLPGFIKIVIPIFLVIVEIGVSYFSILKQRSGEDSSLITKYLQYFVIGILIAFSCLIVSYSVRGYNPQFDGKSFMNFLLSSAIVQIILLIPSIMLHIWIIKNAEDITEAISYYLYKIHRSRLIGEIEKLEAANKDYWRQFVELSHKYAQLKDAFRQKHPGVDAGFERTMPKDLAKAINMAMGTHEEDNLFAESTN